ncbi:MAG: hypothetical protein LBQ18_07210, partial [Campylobacteraceae bacterium]|nr:hypothetical protein [Campylobacteraceae bacterium]
MTKTETKNSLQTKKEIAKAGMTASLAIVTLSALMLKNKTAKKLHVGAGIALIGFSYWHHSLYQPKAEKPKEHKGHKKIHAK